MEIKALTFDVFGTVVDWRSTIVREGEQLNRDMGLEVDWAQFADAWRARYQPSMERVRSGARPWTVLDVLHRESLAQLAPAFGLDAIGADALDRLNQVWHRLDPWPDSVPALRRLKQRFVLATLSNGNVALLVNMAKRAGLPWDAVLGAEVSRCYKPQPHAYVGTVRMLGIEPRQCLMVAAHNADLLAARDCGMRTAFVHRPTEHGPAQTTDLRPEADYDFVARDLQELAAQLGC